MKTEVFGYSITVFYFILRSQFCSNARLLLDDSYMEIEAKG